LRDRWSRITRFGRRPLTQARASIDGRMTENDVPTDLLVIAFDGVNASANAYTAARRRSATASRWEDRVGLVEHGADGRLALHGVFAGHYLDVDERLHASEEGAAEGWRAGALVGLLLGPPGFAVGNVLGAAVGSQDHDGAETDPEPPLVADELRTAVPAPGSAVVLVADAGTCDEMLGAFDLGEARVSRRRLSSEDLEALQISLRDTPSAASASGAAAAERGEPTAEHGRS
jgi:uncharacterized membrane protein